MNRKRRRRRRFALLVLLSMILAAALGIQFRIRPMLRAIAEIQVVNAASSALAGAVNRQMAEGRRTTADSSPLKRMRPGRSRPCAPTPGRSRA